jgi:aldose sugar dehydrogenase
VTSLLVAGGITSIIGVLGILAMACGVPVAQRLSVVVPGESFMSSDQKQAEIVAVASRTDQKLWLIDPSGARVSAPIDVGMTVRNMVLAPDGVTAWIFNDQPGQTDFATVNLVRGSRSQTQRLGHDPISVAFSSDGMRAYVPLGAGNESPPAPSSVLFMNAATTNEAAHVDVGQQTPGVQIQRSLAAIGVAPGQQGDVIYVAGRASGTVWALDGASGAVLQQIEVGGGPMAIVVDPMQQRVFVVCDTTNELVAIDATDQTIAGRLALPGQPSGMALAPGGELYVSGVHEGQLWPIDVASWRVSTPIPVGPEPSGVAISLGGHVAYVTLAGDGSFVTVDLSTNQVTSKLSIGGEPSAVLVAHGSDTTSASGSAAPTPGFPAVRPTLTLPAPTPQASGAQPSEHLPSGAASESFMGANSPVALAFANDGTLFYAELTTGKIRVVQNGVLIPEPFYKFTVAGGPETGLLGLALDPNFDTNHYVYAFYTSVAAGKGSGGPNGPNEVVRLTDVGNKGTDPTPLLELPSAPIHNGGTLGFGPDGKLYVALGDNDQGSNAQDLTALSGKVLRINTDGSIPEDNPFASQPGKQAAIWAYGLRNPFGFDFDPVSGGLFATENGPGDNDELDLIAGGGNYGWPPTGYKHKPGVVDPIAVMNPPIGPTGSAFYTGHQIPSWTNDWFYCNYHQSQLRRVHLAPESRDRVVFEEVVKNGCTLAVANGPDGALYYTDAKGIYSIHSADAAGLIPIPVTSASEAPAPTSTAEVVAPGMRAEDRDVGVTLNEWNLQPSRSEVPSGQIRFLAENTGDLQHAFRIVGGAIDATTDSFGPGASRTLEVALPPGTYQLTCPIPGHEELGMSSTITVVGP